MTADQLHAGTLVGAGETGAQGGHEPYVSKLKFTVRHGQGEPKKGFASLPGINLVYNLSFSSMAPTASV